MRYKIPGFLKSDKRLPILIGLLFTSLILWVHTNLSPDSSGLVQRLELLVYDQRFNSMPKIEKSAEHKIVIVDLDERSMQAEGHYPWSRFRVGQLLEKLRDGGALVVGFDITFPEADRNIRDLLEPIDMASLDQDFVETLELLEPLIDADQYFAAAMRTNIDVVLPISFDRLSTVTYNSLPRNVVEIDENTAQRISLIDTHGFTGNLDILQNAADGAGSMNQEPDIDGIVRRAPLVLRYGTRLFPSLALEMARVYSFADHYELITEDYNGYEVVIGVRVGNGPGAFEIPTDDLGQVLVPYVGGTSMYNSEHYPYLSATDVLHDNLSDEQKLALENSLVLVGASANGTNDIKATPLGSSFPGVEVHANLLNGLLQSMTTIEVGSAEATTQTIFDDFERSRSVYFPYKPDWEVGALFFIILLLGIVMSFLFPFLGPLALAATGVTLIVISTWINFQLWAIFKMDFSLVLPMFLVVLLTMLNVVTGFINESSRRKIIKFMFGQYVPPAHIEAMLSNQGSYSFEGESKDLTVLFADIRSFTTISETLSASQLKTLLNELFTPLTAIIFKHFGTVDKYVGDTVMAFWGAPLNDKHHRRNAVLAGLEMLQRVEELNINFVAKGLPKVSVGIGINSGMMNVGDMGSTYRRAYTVLGDAVNLGSRLESLTRYYGIKMLIGEGTAKELDGVLLRMVDKVIVKGRDTAIKCYEPICLMKQASTEQIERVELYHQALNQYFNKQWELAERGFRELSNHPMDAKLCDIYLGRIQILRDVPLAEDWEGSFHHTSK